MLKGRGLWLTSCSPVTPVQLNFHKMLCPFIRYFEGSRMCTLKDMQSFVKGDSYEPKMNAHMCVMI